MGVLILVSITIAVLATESSIELHHQVWINRADRIVGIFFVVEYLLRAWVAPLDPRYGRGLRGVLCYLRTPMAMLDFIALLPLIIGPLGAELYILRLVRLVRIARIGRSRKFKRSLRHFNYAIQSKWQELQISFVYVCVFILMSAVLMYVLEGQTQPAAFGSIPRALWWAVMTITTVGYGDVVPITIPGKIVAAMTALLGIGAIAIPTGILASGFSDSIAKEKQIAQRQADFED